MPFMDGPCVIGLCGRSGAGKSFVSHLFGVHGVPSVNTDLVYRELTTAGRFGKRSECLEKLVDEFGSGILTSDGSLNRRALADIVFNKGGDESRRTLNRITHKYILEETERRIAEFGKSGAWAVVVDAPLLFESGFDKKCDFIVAAVAPEQLLVERIMMRDSINVDAAIRRLAVQLSDAEVRRRADHIIETDTTSDEVSVRVSRILHCIHEQLNGKGKE